MPLSAKGGPPQGAAAGVVVLSHGDVVRIQANVLVGLHAARGEAGAWRHVLRQRAALAHACSRIGSGPGSRAPVAVARRAREVAAIAADLGLPDLEAAALNLARCATGHDDTAYAATAARLRRLSAATVRGIAPMAGRNP